LLILAVYTISSMTHLETRNHDWLRSNLRLAGLLAVIASFLFLSSLAICGVALWFSGGLSGVAFLFSAGLGILSCIIGYLAFTAKQGRIFLKDSELIVRIGPASVERLPLDAVECFFLGSQPLDHSGDPVASDEAAFRVGTLVVRVAERYGHLASGRRGPWACWEDGYLVVDGRWSEPLVVETLRRINGRLAVAKRQPVVDPCMSSGASEGCCG
jgi:hypothetical protein